MSFAGVANGNHYLSVLNLDIPLTSLPAAMFTDSGLLHFCVTTCLAAISIIANVYLIVFIARTKSTRTCKNSCYGYYLLHLCVVEITMAALSIPFSLVCHSENLDHRVSFYEIGCIIKRLLCCVCHGTIAIMVYQRFLCLHNSIRKRKAFVNLKISLCLVWFWAIANLIPQVILFTKSSETENKESSVNIIVLIVSLLFIPLMVTLHSRFGLSRLHSKDSVLLLKRCRQYRKFASVCLLMSCVLVTANLPEFITNLLIQLNYEKKIQLKPSTGFLWTTITLSWVNLPLLPITYCLSYMVKLTKEQKGLKDKNNNTIASMIESRFFPSPGPLRYAFLPTNSNPDPNTRRRSLFDRRKSSLEDALDICSRRFSEPNVDLNPQLITSCLSTLESIYESHTKKKSFFKDRWRRFSGVVLESTEESLASSSQELSTFPHVVHKLNQKSSNMLQVEMPHNV